MEAELTGILVEMGFRIEYQMFQEGFRICWSSRPNWPPPLPINADQNGEVAECSLAAHFNQVAADYSLKKKTYYKKVADNINKKLLD